MDEILIGAKWEDITCPICLEYPHNGVLLQCSSYDKGCRAFVCDTDHLHSNCLDRFKNAYKVSSKMQLLSIDVNSSENNHLSNPEAIEKPLCPLCRGEVTGWIAVNEAREELDKKKRCCEEELCLFMGTYLELKKHAQLEHPHSRPSKVDNARQLEWENFQQSSDIIDVLSTIHSEVPHGVILGDYVIEYGDDDSGDEFEEFPRGEGNWWTSCILYQVFDNLRTSRNRRRSRTNNTRRGDRHSNSNSSNSDESSVASIEFSEQRIDENDDELVTAVGLPMARSGHRNSQGRNSRFYDN